jgi:hypothetical protein
MPTRPVPFRRSEAMLVAVTVLAVPRKEADVAVAVAAGSAGKPTIHR